MAAAGALSISWRDWPLGVNCSGDNPATVLVWAPKLPLVSVRLEDGRVEALERVEDGYHCARLNGVKPGTRYFLSAGAHRELPDPASRFQPEGVHGPSEVTGGHFEWNDAAWPGLPLKSYVIYELHVGTFSGAGTFDGVLAHLQELKDLGVTAIELMPVAQFPGARNWGYDGVLPFAVQNTYGGPQGLKRLVNACHQLGIAVVLDVVYNHLGPEGNWLPVFAPYFTDTYKTPWGAALNFDGEDSDQVRRYFVENALYWQTEFHIDALRLDAVHAIRDFSARPFLAELGEATRRRAQALNRRFQLIAESDLNDPKVIVPTQQNGWQMDAQWSDDFHHSLHVLLTGERDGYYAGFGGIRPLARVLRYGYTYTGQYSAFRKRKYGRLPVGIAPRQMVVCSQNHDQVGNRMLGERLPALTGFESLKVAAAAVILSPFTPLLFMGEEYSEPAPFQYFTSHRDRDLAEAVRKGRRQEFSGFAQPDEVPDPQDENTFLRSCLSRLDPGEGPGQPRLRAFYRELIRTRKQFDLGAFNGFDEFEVRHGETVPWLWVVYLTTRPRLALLLWFGGSPGQVTTTLPEGRWRVLLNSQQPEFDGPGKGLHLDMNDGAVYLGSEPGCLVLEEALENDHSPEKIQHKGQS